MLRKLWLGLFSSGVVAALMVGCFWFFLQNYVKAPLVANIQETLEFVVKPGDSVTSVANSLAKQGWLEYPELFALLARVQGVSARINAGEYLLHAQLNKQQLLNLLVKGKVRSFKVTLVEGQTIAEALKVLNSNKKLSDPLSEAAFERFLKSLKLKGSAEGLFYPDTYFFYSGASVASILKRASERLDQVLAEEWNKRSDGLPYKTPYEALIMASLVEKETGAAFERPEIAGVFVRRLKKGMRLQTDPSVIYGIRDEYKGDLTRKMLRKPTPYNTYRNKGLPPTPIALSGREAIRAALHPGKGNTYYFVAKGDGTHVFSESLTQHVRAVRKYQITERNKNYRSTVIKAGETP